jgi:dihydrofolate synthase/folylpolyglutamate synthase
VNYTEALAWLYGTQDRGIKLGLDRVRAFLEALGWEGGRYLHVAGTNGKGSVCAMLDSICRASGMRTGLFTSPHLITFRERIRLDGEMAVEEEGWRWCFSSVTQWTSSCWRLASEDGWMRRTSCFRTYR